MRPKYIPNSNVVASDDPQVRWQQFTQVAAMCNQMTDITTPPDKLLTPAKLQMIYNSQNDATPNKRNTN